MRKAIPLLLAIALLAAGLGVLFYPQISSWVNERNSSRAIQTFARQMEQAGDEALAEQLSLAAGYNARLTQALSAPAGNEYYDILDFGSGMMGYIEIPAIDVELPIYHGISADVLAKGVGHMAQSAFPIGGTGNHTVLTGHTGLPSAPLFTDLYKLEPGDLFQITVGTSTVYYQVDQILTVLPEDTSELTPAAGKDLCTLVTCTPYGINSHRLLVRGSRIEPETADAQVTVPDTSRTTPKSMMLWLTVPVLAAVMTFLLLWRRRKRRKPQ